MAEKTTGNPVLDIINTVGTSAKPNPAPSSKPVPGTGSGKISPTHAPIKVPMSKIIGGSRK
mgnify:CR=1 FL=1